MRGRGRVVRRLGVMALALVAGVGPGWQPVQAAGESEPATKNDMSALRLDVERLRTELENVRGEIRLMRELLLQRLAQPAPAAPPAPPAPVTGKVKVSGAPTLGKPDAPVTLVEFSDYQCPFCKRFYDTTLPSLKAAYVETGKVRYVFRDFPLEQIHPQARKAAEAARCAGEQGKYWEMHDTLFKNQQGLMVDNLKAHAKSLGVEAKTFDECLDKAKYAAQVQADYDEGINAGIRGTPGFFVGKTRSDGTVEGVMISGARPFNDFKQEIERVLAEKK